MKNKCKCLVLLASVIIVCLAFVSCGKKNVTKDTQTNEYEKSINSAKEIAKSYNELVLKGDFKVQIEFLDNESKLYKKIKNINYAEALSMFGFDRATSLQISEDDMKKIYDSIMEKTKIEIDDVKINVDRTKAVAEVAFVGPNYKSIKPDNLISEFLNGKGMHESELSFVSYNQYEELTKEYAKWIIDKKLASLKSITTKKDYDMKEKNGKWFICEIE